MTKELRNKLLSQVLLAFSQLIFPVVTYPVVTRALGAPGLGKVNFADSIVQTLLIFASLGIPLYGIREIAIRKNKKEAQSRTFLELFLLQSVFVIPAIAGIWIVGSISHVTPALLWTGTIALAASCLSCDWFLQGREAFLWVAVRTALIRAVAALLILLLIKNPGDAVRYYMILTGSVVLALLSNAAVIIPNIRPGTGPVDPWQHLKKINWVYGCYVLASLYTLADSLLLGWMCSDQAVGYYSFAYRIVRMTAMLIPTLGVVFIPGIAFHHAAEDKAGVQRQINASQQLIIFFGIPLSLCFFVLAPELIAVFAGNGFLPSIPVIRILSLVPLLVSLSHLAGTQVLVSMKKEKIYLAFLAGGCVLNIACDLVLIPFFREQAAAYSNLATEAFVALGALAYLNKQGLLVLPLRQIVQCLLAGLLLLPVVALLRRVQAAPLLVLVLGTGMTGLVYLGLFFRNRRRAGKGR